MTGKRPQSLTLASDPVARLRELHDLDNHPRQAAEARADENPPIHERNVPTQERSSASPPPQSSVASIAQSHEDTPQQGYAATSQRGNDGTNRRTHAPTPQRVPNDSG